MNHADLPLEIKKKIISYLDKQCYWCNKKIYILSAEIRIDKNTIHPIQFCSSDCHWEYFLYA